MILFCNRSLNVIELINLYGGTLYYVVILDAMLCVTKEEEKGQLWLSEILFVYCGTFLCC